VVAVKRKQEKQQAKEQAVEANDWEAQQRAYLKGKMDTSIFNND
jgi:hypothetical protein